MTILDRAARAALAVAALSVALGADAGSVVAIFLFAVAALMGATSAVGFCPLYAALRALRGRTPLPH
jgi:Inner membrane protein YgaP-like, transmembrane domain